MRRTRTGQESRPACRRAASTAAALFLSAVLVLLSSSCSDELLLAIQDDVERATNTEAPTGSVSINAGAEYTQGTGVTLTLSAVAVVGSVDSMEVRNDAAFTGNWQAYATSLGWSLDATDGTRTVYVRFRDDTGNISSTYTDTIILDRQSPTISTRTPLSDAVNQSRSVNAVVTFSENMDQSTFTSTSSEVTSTVYLRIKGMTAPVPVVMTKTATSVTLNPVSNLNYGYDYEIVVTGDVKDLSGRAITNPGSTDFTVEGDIWEGGSNNDAPARAYFLSDNNLYGSWNWTDLVPDTQEETDSWLPPVGANTTLARLEGVDYYAIDVPADALYLHLRVLFTTDSANGTIVDSAGTDSLVLYVTHNGYSFGSYITVNTNQAYDKFNTYDLSAPLAGGAGTYTILVYEASSNYANRRTYNLRWYFEPGI